MAWYATRWGIAVWHTVLMRGCLTLYSVIAWRILYATMLARVALDVPCTVLLDDNKWQGCTAASIGSRARRRRR